MAFRFSCVSRVRTAHGDIATIMYLLIVDVQPPNWLSTMGGSMGITVTSTCIVSSSTASTGIGSIGVALPSIAVTGVAVPTVIGVGGMLVTCLLLVLCLLSVRLQKHLL